MNLPNNPLCPVCRAPMIQTIPGAGGLWACPSHGDFTGGGSPAGAAVSATVGLDGGAGSYVPAVDVLTVQGGVAPTKPTFNVTHTEVRSASVTAGHAGSGGTDGAGKIVTGTGGVTPFQASVTVSGGAIVSVQSISVKGDYTTNPTLLGQAVTGDSLTGAQLDVVMGVKTVALAGGGSVQAAAPNPAPTINTGTATGCQLTVTYGAGATDSATIQGLAEAESGAAGANLLTRGL